MGRNLCDNCINNLLSRCTRHDILIIDFLIKNEIDNSCISITKEKISQLMGEESSLAKCSKSIERLEAMGFIDNKVNGRATCYYINEDGKYALELFLLLLSKKKKLLEGNEE